MRHHDVVLLGTGSGNTIFTRRFTGLDIAIVEPGPFGGTCLNVGCIPTKMFVLPADRVQEARDSARLGIRFADPGVDWPAIRDRVFGRVDPIADGGERHRRSQHNVTVYAASARFVGERRFALSSGEQISADRVVVAVGSRPAGYPVDGLREPAPQFGLHTSDTIMRLRELPETMIIVGGGFVACEFAHVFSSLGVRVTQVQRSEHLLRGEDEAVSRRYTELAGERYDLRTQRLVTAAVHDGRTWRLTLRHTGESGADSGTAGGGADEMEASGRPEGTPETVTAPVVLLAVGRRSNADRLDPAAGGLALTAHDRIVVDAEQRTTAPGVWALGDICNDWQLKHVANREARTVSHDLLLDLGRLDPGTQPLQTDHRFVPHAVFGYPQVASFGPTRGDLIAAGRPFLEKTQAFGDVAYGWALDDHEGFLTVYADPDTERILAAHCIGPQASTLIQPLIQAATFGQRAHDVARGQYWIHPALSEVVENALLGLAPAQ